MSIFVYSYTVNIIDNHLTYGTGGTGGTGGIGGTGGTERERRLSPLTAP